MKSVTPESMSNLCPSWINERLCLEATYMLSLKDKKGRRGGLIVSALDSGASGPGSSPGRGHSHGASLHPGV